LAYLKDFDPTISLLIEISYHTMRETRLYRSLEAFNFAASEIAMNVQNPPRFGGNGAEPRRRKARGTPKGRQIDPGAAAEIAALLGDRSRQRDLLIEHLHLIQDKYGHDLQRAPDRARRLR
jgi:hypothetical protein